MTEQLSLWLIFWTETPGITSVIAVGDPENHSETRSGCWTPNTWRVPYHRVLYLSLTLTWPIKTAAKTLNYCRQYQVLWIFKIEVLYLNPFRHLFLPLFRWSFSAAGTLAWQLGKSSWIFWICNLQSAGHRLLEIATGKVVDICHFDDLFHQKPSNTWVYPCRKIWQSMAKSWSFGWILPRVHQAMAKSLHRFMAFHG